MWIPALIAISSTVGPASMGAVALFIIQKIVYFYDEVSDFSENMTSYQQNQIELKQNQEEILNQLKELKMEKELAAKEAAKPFDYSSYLTYSMLFKVSFVVVLCVGSVYGYNHLFATSSNSNVLETLHHMSSVNNANFHAVDKRLDSVLLTINEVGIKNTGEVIQAVGSNIDSTKIALNTNLQVVYQDIIQYIGKIVTNDVEKAKIPLKVSLDIFKFLQDQASKANIKNESNLGLFNGFTLDNPKAYDNL